MDSSDLPPDTRPILRRPRAPTTMEAMISSKSMRDAVQMEIVKVLSRTVDLPQELKALLAAHKGCTAEMEQAIANHLAAETLRDL